MGLTARIWCGMALIARSAFALSPALSVHQYLHSSWMEMDGEAIPAIQKIVQAADGYLWLGTDHGLLRFNGLRFASGFAGETQEGRGRNVYWLAASPRGGLWTATENGITRFDRGNPRIYPIHLAGRLVSALFEDRAGDVWLASSSREGGVIEVLSPRDGSVRRFGRAEGLPEDSVESIAPDGDSFWLGTNGSLCRWKPGEAAVCRAVEGSVTSLFVAGTDNVFAATWRAILHASSGSLETLASMPSELTIGRADLVVDRDRNVWVGTSGGLLRVQGHSVERFSRKDGLSADYVMALFEDHEGDIWVATNGGIDRFRNPRVLHLSSVDGLSGDSTMAVQGARDGSTWVGTSGNGVNRVLGREIRAYSIADGVPGKSVLSLYEDALGRMWMGGTTGLAYFHNGRFTTIRTAAGKPIISVFGIGGDSGGTVWAAAEANGLWRIRAERPEAVSATPLKDIFRVTHSRDGLLWAGSFANGVVTISGASETAVFGSQAGVGPGAPRAIHEDPSGAVWVGAGSTLTRFRNGRLTTWGSREGLPEGEIYGITDDARGGLWIVTTTSVLRLALGDLARVPDGAPQPIRFAQYDKRDGLRLAERAGMGAPHISAARDGRIWICERDGVGVLDPDLLAPNPIPPPVHVEQFTVDGRGLSGSLPSFRGRQVRISYSGLSLTAPERVRYRYRLDPVDSNWTEGDTRREVTFVNLPPGRYRFRVIACNLDGVWNEAGDGVDFRVVPYFTQTIWFKLSIAFAAGLAGWMIYRLRMRQLLARFRIVAQERARVTREIHDSLLQGFAGVVFQLYAASRQFDSNPQQSKEKLDRALDQADTSLREARQMMMDMRLPVLEDRTLPDALAEVGANAVAETSVAFQLKTKGRVAPLAYSAQAAMFLIGREAINNAVNHAGASRITVQLTYSDKEFRMTVQDDGSGFDPEAARQKEGHFGVQSMGERAKQVGAAFGIDTAPGRGAKIEVSVPRRAPRENA